eukprot:INCI6213.5.p1 GENE.INCI6213.5~~INCI6213.5.p1  ORF type:complete len:1046 (-),score=173.36 INCI6213.5:254-3244(-)
MPPALHRRKTSTASEQKPLAGTANRPSTAGAVLQAHHQQQHRADAAVVNFKNPPLEGQLTSHHGRRKGQQQQQGTRSQLPAKQTLRRVLENPSEVPTGLETDSLRLAGNSRPRARTSPDEADTFQISPIRASQQRVMPELEWQSPTTPTSQNGPNVQAQARTNSLGRHDQIHRNGLRRQESKRAMGEPVGRLVESKTSGPVESMVVAVDAAPGSSGHRIEVVAEAVHQHFPDSVVLVQSKTHGQCHKSRPTQPSPFGPHATSWKAWVEGITHTKDKRHIEKLRERVAALHKEAQTIHMGSVVGKHGEDSMGSLEGGEAKGLVDKNTSNGIVAADASYDSLSSIHFYSVSTLIGEGAFGKVWSGRHRLAQTSVAIKSFEKARIKDRQAWNRIKREARLLKRLNHPGICTMLEWIETPKRAHLVLEIANMGNLSEYIKRDRPAPAHLENQQASELVTQLIDAVAYLHRHRIVHRDVKLANCLVFTSPSDPLPVLKLTDFGLSMAVPDEDHKLQIFCGTPSYMAPEIVQRTPYRGQPADMWSLGILMVIVLTGTMPFHARSEVELYKHILRGSFQLSSGISGLAKDLIMRLLEKIPARRITAAQAAGHPWCTRPHKKTRHTEQPSQGVGLDGQAEPGSKDTSSVSDPNSVNDKVGPYSEPANRTPVGRILSRAVVAFMCEDVLPLSYRWLKNDLLRDRRNPVTATYWLLWQQLYGIRAATEARKRLRDFQDQQMRAVLGGKASVDEGDAYLSKGKTKRSAGKHRRHHRKSRHSIEKSRTQRGRGDVAHDPGSIDVGKPPATANRDIPGKGQDDSSAGSEDTVVFEGSDEATTPPGDIGARLARGFSKKDKAHMSAAVAKAAAVSPTSGQYREQQQQQPQSQSQIKRKVSVGTWMVDENGRVQAKPAATGTTSQDRSSVEGPHKTINTGKHPNLVEQDGTSVTSSPEGSPRAGDVDDGPHLQLRKQSPHKSMSPNSRRILYNARKNRFALIAASAAGDAD